VVEIRIPPRYAVDSVISHETERTGSEPSPYQNSDKVRVLPARVAPVVNLSMLVGCNDVSCPSHWRRLCPAKHMLAVRNIYIVDAIRRHTKVWNGGVGLTKLD
jgi:hypothetical protein